MKNENYVVIQGWMVNELKLSGNELILYALIYGFSQDGKSKFQGAMQYIADTLGISRQATLDLLKKLVDKKYIGKFEYGQNGNKKCDYEVNYNYLKDLTGKESLPVTGKETLQDEQEPVKKLVRTGKVSCQTGKETLHHIAIIKLDKANKNSPPETAEQTTDVSNKKIELNEKQSELFRAAKACFDTSNKTKALIYKDRKTAAMQMRLLKEIVISCTEIEPDFSADFLKTVLEHFRILCNGKLKGKAEFTPRALITPWIWELVVGSLPEAESPELRESIKGMFK